MVSVDLPEPETPVMQVNRPMGISAVRVLRLLPVAPTTRSALPFCGGRRTARHVDEAGARQELAGERGRIGHHLVGRALGDDLAAMDAGGGADIDDVIGLADGVLVMLDDDDGVADVAQVLERAEQALVVALVEADGGLVEDVEHAGEAGADLAGQPDALALAARQRARGAGKRQIIQADIDEKVQPLADLLEDADGDLVLLLGQRFGQVGEPGERAADGEVGHLGNVARIELDGERLRLQALAAAGLARLGRMVALDLLAHPGGIGLAVAAVEIGDDAFEGLGGAVGPEAVIVVEGDGFLAGAVEDDVAGLLRQLVPGGVGGELVGAGKRLQGLQVIGRRGLRPRRDGAVAQRQRVVGDDQSGVDDALGAEPVANGTSAIGIVEGEQARLDLGDGEAGDRAGEFLGENDAFVFAHGRRAARAASAGAA